MLLALMTLDSIGKVVTFLIMLSILVVLHEYGHFLIARRNGVRVNEFAVGMGPKIVGWTSPRSGTLYSIRALPIGGYCAMQGEDGKTSQAEQQREFREARAQGLPEGHDNFQSKSAWQRLAIVLAGPVANFILCYAILLIGALTFGIASDKPLPVVGFVESGSPASVVGLQAGDRILSIDGQTFADGNGLVAKLHDSKGRRLDLVYDRGGTQHETYITPGSCPASQPARSGCIGIAPAPSYARTSPADAFRAANENFVSIASQTFSGLGLMVTHFSHYAGQATGVIGMGQLATTIQDFGWGPYCMLAAMISFALGLFNLLPIPALDGGRAAFIIAELVRGRPVDPEKEAMIHIAGFAALMALMVLVAAHDIARIASGRGLLG